MNLQKEISHLLRQIADRIDTGTCELTPEDTFQVFMLLRGGQKPSTLQHLQSIEEAYGLLSTRLDRLERKGSVPPAPTSKAGHSSTPIIPLRKK